MNDRSLDTRHAAKEAFEDSLEQLKSLFEVLDAEETAASSEPVEEDELTWDDVARDLDLHFQSQPPRKE
ncbi:hypothetical protein [Oscillatoria sp. FACHB-1406]|uniref:hypothetical protein n=1 Tax=Oscillatoria sp. FACHB-1406 TaxID=2692846 RepID=UPI001686654B|nr:hypothetical protein [Oscillatoria sp. FACHB-1406]MBD2577264.1 hypothetical protein [Oscillatoria sp. FACHB-1406]